MEFGDLDPSRSVLERVPEDLARESVVLPVRVDEGKLVLAVHDPHDIDKLLKLQFILNQDILIVEFPRRQLLKAIERAYADSPPTDYTAYFRSNEAIRFQAQANAPEDHILAQVIRVIRTMQNHKAHEGRIAPEEGLLLARVFNHGVLVDESSIARRYHSSIVSTVRTLAGMTPGEQEGRLIATSGGERFAWGVRIVETREGPSVLLRFEPDEART